MPLAGLLYKTFAILNIMAEFFGSTSQDIYGWSVGDCLTRLCHAGPATRPVFSPLRSTRSVDKTKRSNVPLSWQSCSWSLRDRLRHLMDAPGLQGHSLASWQAVGHRAMLDFGWSLAAGVPTFSFPHATNPNRGGFRGGEAVCSRSGTRHPQPRPPATQLKMNTRPKAQMNRQIPQFLSGSGLNMRNLRIRVVV